MRNVAERIAVANASMTTAVAKPTGVPRTASATQPRK